jgi:FtsZ-interacting cell division protein ZipA
MQHVDITTIVIVVLLAIALIAFIIFRNRKDKKKLLKTDPVEDEISDRQRNEDKL